MNTTLPVYILLLSIFIPGVKEAYAQEDTVSISIDNNKIAGTFIPLWGYFGYDEANYTTTKNGKKLLSELASLSTQPVYVRVHNLLTTGDGKAALKWSSTNAYTEDKNGNPVYNWSVVDSIFDVFIKRGIKPIAEIGFMPEALSVKPQPYRHHWKPGLSYDSIYTGWAYPPNSYQKWSQLIYMWVKHCRRRYGEAEVKTWYWEVWNEPNIGYWKGTMQEYFTLYDFTADAVKRAYPDARVGGPTSAGPRWDKAADFLKAFLAHCTNGKNSATGKTGSPLDYITFHAKGAPVVVNNSVQMNMGVQLQDVARGFEIINTFPFLKRLPVIIGEFDPEGCAACSMQFNPQNAYRNGTMYSVYTAASFARLYAMAYKYQVNLRGVVSWSFEFEGQPWFAGFRDLATNGVDKPVLNVFRMFGMMKGNMLMINNPGSLSLEENIDSSVRGNKPYVDALAVSETKNMYIMVWNYHDADNKKIEAAIKLSLLNIPGKSALLSLYRVDEINSNSYTQWKKMGAPQVVNDEQLRELENSGKLKMIGASERLRILEGNINYQLILPGQGVALLKVSW
ncbi:MAG: beta-xylosidase [Ginsengibacter sp.]